MAFFSGKDGVLKIENTQAAKVQNWTYTSNQELLDVTALGDTDRRQDYGLRNGTGSCRIFYYRASASDKGDASTLLNKVIKRRSSSTPKTDSDADTVKLTLGFMDGTTECSLTFDAMNSSANITSAQGDVMSADISFQTTGPVHETMGL